MNLYGVIMAGGVGERFWPLSRNSSPKQFLSMNGGKTLIQETVQRLTPLIPIEKMLIVSNQAQGELLRTQLPDFKNHQFALEPVGRNTAPCIALAAVMIHQMDPEGTMLVVPSDHVIGKPDEYLELIKNAARLAGEKDCLLTIGIKPSLPETGYGYIHCGDKLEYKSQNAFFKVKRFVEKPDLRTAESYLESGEYLWNSGMFVWKVSSILKAFEKYLPEIYQQAMQILPDLLSSRRQSAIERMYASVPKISIDYGVMEKAENIVVGLGDFVWDDVGSWSSLERQLAQDANGNSVSGNHVGTETENCIIINRTGMIGTLGVKDLIIVTTPDAVLVIDKNRAQDVKTLVELMKKKEEFKKFL
jgi:mannose-1-phosphate guanylyltransferase